MIKHDRNNKNVPEGSDSFALFGDDVCVHLDNRNTVVLNKDEQEAEKTKFEKQTGAQSADEKPDKSEHGSEKTGRKIRRGFRALESNKNFIGSESDADAVKGSSRSKTDGQREHVGNEQQNFDKANTRRVRRTRRTKSSISNDEGGNGVQKHGTTATETVDISAYPLKEFETTSVIQNYAINGKPKKTDEFGTVEVLIDGVRRKVSEWAIKDGQYIQGLDSRFLVSKYKTGKK